MRPYTPGNGMRVRNDSTGGPPTSGESARLSVCCADAGSISKAVMPPNSNPARFLIAFMGDLRAVVTFYRGNKISCSHSHASPVLESISHFEAPVALTAGTGATASHAQNRSM